MIYTRRKLEQFLQYIRSWGEFSHASSTFYIFYFNRSLPNENVIHCSAFLPWFSKTTLIGSTRHWKRMYFPHAKIACRNSTMWFKNQTGFNFSEFSRKLKQSLWIDMFMPMFFDWVFASTCMSTARLPFGLFENVWHK